MQRLIPSETALVLGGGGAKGAYEIGVIDALEELGIRAGSVYGVSIGAINAAMYAQERIDAARALWDSLTVSDIVSEEDAALAEEAETMFDRADKLLEFITRNAHHKGLDTSPMEQMLGRFISEDVLRASTIRFGLVTTRFPSLSMVQKRLEDMEPGSVCSWLLASAACYPAFPMRTVGSERYIDGGFCDNTPVDMAVRAGARHVIAVDIGKHPSHMQYVARPNITYIRATHPLGGLLTFDPERSRRNRVLGYNDTMRAFGRMRGTLYAFDPVDAQALGARAQDFVVYLTQFEAGLRLQSALDRKGGSPLFSLLEETLRPGADAIDYFLRACELCAAALEVEPAQVLTFEALRGELRARLPLEKAESMLDSLLGGRIGVLFAPPQPDRKLILACLYHLLQRESTFSPLALHTLSAFPRELLCALTLREVL